jgi:hypothetical protein
MGRGLSPVAIGHARLKQAAASSSHEGPQETLREAVVLGSVGRCRRMHDALFIEPEI